MYSEETVITKVENLLEPLAVGNLLRQENGEPVYKFFIPSYQRGYRWDNEQVEDLLNDLFEFITTSESKKEKYCLQPIVVKQLENKKYEVLDGQQRLTTIHILLSRLKKNNSEIELFSLQYETRPGSAAFLNNISEEINRDNPDYFYISNAYMTIDRWLVEAKKKRANIQGKLFDAIVESIEFIWYEIKNEVDAIDVFTRINIGKIPLTNAELVKAVFLSKNNLSLGYASSEINSEDFGKILTLKQNAIALEWDNMEKTLQDPKVWGFIYGGNKNYETRIDYLLDLESHKSDRDTNKYYSFKYFYDKVKNIRNDKELLDDLAKTNYSFIEQQWNILKSNYEILLEWYNDKTYNHLIGFLITQQVQVIDIIEEFKNKNRKNFLTYIKSRIVLSIDCTDISKLRYDRSSDYKKIERVLLMHNVINSLKINDNNIYFPFDKMKGKSWSLEHIFAQNSDELRAEDYNNWLTDHLEFFKIRKKEEECKSIIDTIEKLLLSKDIKNQKEAIESCMMKVSGYIQKSIQQIDNDNVGQISDEVDIKKEFDWINEDHSIANLALLDGGLNSALKNSLFDIKRKQIIQKDKDGLFIPNETKKVFLKYYTPMPNHLAYWTFEDRKAYVGSIKSSINYLK